MYQDRGLPIDWLGLSLLALPPDPLRRSDGAEDLLLRIADGERSRFLARRKLFESGKEFARVGCRRRHQKHQHHRQRRALSHRGKDAQRTHHGRDAHRQGAHLGDAGCGRSVGARTMYRRRADQPDSLATRPARTVSLTDLRRSPTATRRTTSTSPAISPRSSASR